MTIEAFAWRCLILLALGQFLVEPGQASERASTAEALQASAQRDTAPKPLEMVIASNELSRIALDGGRLAALVDYRQELIAKKDEGTGQFFIAPKPGIAKPINVFAIDEAGSTYALLLHARDVPAQSILLKPLRPVANTAKTLPRAASLQRIVKEIVLALSAQSTASARTGVTVNTVNDPLRFWPNTRLVRTATTTLNDYQGERFSLINDQPIELVLREEDFLREGVVAVAIAHPVLPPNTITSVFVVRERAPVSSERTSMAGTGAAAH